MADIFCTTCGHALKDSARFCPECGTNREIATVSPPSPAGSIVESSSLPPSITETVESAYIAGPLERLKALPKAVSIGVSALFLLVLFFGARVVGSSGGDPTAETIVSTSPTSSESVAPIPTPVNRYLELGSIESTCESDELWWDDSSGSFVINGTSSRASVADAWKYRGRENIIVQCGYDSQVSVAIVLKLEADRLRLISFASAVGELVERHSDTVVRVGVSRACCYPEVPLESASVFRFQFRGQIKTDTRAIVRFSEWDVVAWRCHSMNEPEWYEGEDLDGEAFADAESGFLTVCSESSDVSDLQNVLIDKGYDIESDGQFGPGTLDALLDFAEESGMYGVEGVVLSDNDFRYARHRS